MFFVYFVKLLWCPSFRTLDHFLSNSPTAAFTDERDQKEPERGSIIIMQAPLSLYRYIHQSHIYTQKSWPNIKKLQLPILLDLIEQRLRCWPCLSNRESPQFYVFHCIQKQVICSELQLQISILLVVSVTDNVGLSQRLLTLTVLQFSILWFLNIHERLGSHQLMVKRCRKP